MEDDARAQERPPQALDRPAAPAGLAVGGAASPDGRPFRRRSGPGDPDPEGGGRAAARRRQGRGRRRRDRLCARPRGSGPEDRGLDRGRDLASRVRARRPSAHGRGAQDPGRRRTAGVLAGRGPGRARSRGLPAARGHERGAGVRGQLRQEQAGRPEEPVYGGHATAMGPPPVEAPAASRARPGPRGALRPGARPAHGGDLRRRSLQVAPRRVRGQRRRPPRLRRRRPPRHLHGERVRAGREERAGPHPAPQRPLPQPGRDEVRERGRRGRRGRGGLGLRRVRRGLRRRRHGSTSTSPTTAPTSCSGTRETARSRKWPRRPAWRPTAGAPAAPSSTPTATETWTCTWPATSPPPGRRSRPPGAS